MNLVRPQLAVLCAAVFLLSVFSVEAKDDWLNIRTANFNLVGNASEKELRQVATKLEQFRETFRQIFPGAKLSSPIQTNVVVFKSSSAYDPYRPKRPDGKPDTGIAGYFQAGEDVNYITLSTEGEREDTYGTIFHEYVHNILSTNFGSGNIPPWFNEGLAEYYQMFQIEDDQKVALGRIQNVHLDLLQRTKLIPLKQFFAIDNYSLHQNGDHSRSIFYAQAWALVHYLIQANGGANLEAMGNFLKLSMGGTEPEEAFKQAFKSDYASMERSLKNYVEQRKFFYTTVTFKKKLTFDDEMKVSPLSNAEANAYLGDLLYHTRQYEAAEARLKEALAVKPDLSMALTSLGLVKMRQRKFAEAKENLEKAIADDQKNHFAFYNYAYVLSREYADEFGYVSKFPPDVVDKIRIALKRSIALNREFAESYRLLAWVGLISGDDLNESLETIKTAITYRPGNEQYLLLMAQILLRQEKIKDAKLVADHLIKTASEEGTRTNAERILSSIIQFENAKAAAEKQVDIIVTGGEKRPTFVRRETLTDEQIAKIEHDREIRNLNIVLEKLKRGEKRTLGRLTQIKCEKGEVLYTAETSSGKLTLRSKDFQELDLTILREGTNDVSVGCDANIGTEFVVITYLPSDISKPGSKDLLTGLAFVPDDFRLMTADEVANAPNIIVQGGPPTDLERNAEEAAEQQAKMEQRRREMMMQQIDRALRKAQDGETRVLGGIEKIECSGKNITAIIRSANVSLRLRSPQPNELHLKTFVPDLGNSQLGCGFGAPDISAVITYRPSGDPKAKFAGDLVSIEFVPKTFVLVPSEN